MPEGTSQLAWWWYALPALPLLLRIPAVLLFARKMPLLLDEKEKDREGNRSLVYAMAPLAFAALLATGVVDKAAKPDFSSQVYFLAVSFSAYLVALNLQAYKNRRWHDLLSDACIEIGQLGLVLSIVSLLILTSSQLEVVGVVALAMLVIPFADTISRLLRTYMFLQGGRQ